MIPLFPLVHPGEDPTVIVEALKKVRVLLLVTPDIQLVVQSVAEISVAKQVTDSRRLQPLNIL